MAFSDYNYVQRLLTIFSRKNVEHYTSNIQPKDIVSSLKSYLEDGEIESLADVCQIIYSNNHFKGVQGQLLNKLFQIVKYIEPVSNSEEDKKYAAFIERTLFDEIHEETLYEHIYKMLLFRSGMLIYDFKTIDDKWYPCNFKNVPIQNFVIVNNKLMGAPNDKHNKPWDISKLKNNITVHNELETLPLAFNIAEPSLFIKHGKRLLIEFIEACGIPLRSMTYEPRQADKINPSTGKKYLYDYIKSMEVFRRAGYSVHPKGSEIKIHDTIRQAGDHDKLISLMKEEIEMALLNNTNTTGTSGHESRQNTSEFANIVKEAAQYWFINISKHINEQLIPDLIKVNFGENITRFPKLKMDIPDISTLKLLSKRKDLELDETFLQRHNVPLKKVKNVSK